MTRSIRLPDEGDAGGLDRLQIDRRQQPRPRGIAACRPNSPSNAAMSPTQRSCGAAAMAATGSGLVQQPGHGWRGAADVEDAVLAHHHDRRSLARQPGAADQRPGAPVLGEAFSGIQR